MLTWDICLNKHVFHQIQQTQKWYSSVEILEPRARWVAEMCANTGQQLFFKSQRPPSVLTMSLHTHIFTCVYTGYIMKYVKHTVHQGNVINKVKCSLSPPLKIKFQHVLLLPCLLVNCTEP